MNANRRMTIDEFKERLITEGIASVEKHETRPCRIKGGLAGFELCRKLDSPWDFDDILAKRHKQERHMVSFGVEADVYWEYRYATVQIEFVLERMQVMWLQMGLYSGSVSARAVIRVHEILKG